MAEKRQKKQAVKAFEKETFSKDKEATGVKHTENRQDNTFPTENHFHANEKPVSNLPRDANHGSHRRNATSGHSVQKSEAEAEKAFLKENSFMQDEQSDFETSFDSTIENKVMSGTPTNGLRKKENITKGVCRENTHTESVRSQKIQSSPIMEISRQRMPHFRRGRRTNLQTKKYRRLLISRKRTAESCRKQRTRCRQSGSMR